MKKEKYIIWASQILIPFSIASSAHAYLCLLPKSSVKLAKLKKSFPCIPYCKPRAFEDKSLELGFMKQLHRVLFYFPYINN